MRKLNIDYFVGIDINGKTGKEKATWEKSLYLNKISNKFSLFSITKYSFSFFTLLSMLSIEVKYLLLRLFGNELPDVIFIRSHLGFSPLIISRIYNIKLIHEVHADLLDESKLLFNNNYFKLVFFSQLHKLQIFILKKSTGIIFNNMALEMYYKKQYKFSSQIKTITIHNGCNTKLYYPIDINSAKKEIDLNKYNDYLVFIGNISKWHGVEYILELHQSLIINNPKLILLIVGGSLQKSYLSQLKNKYSSNNIIFTGWVKQKESLFYINSAIAVLVPVNNNRVSPGSPLKLFDSISCGKPIITQENISGYSDLVDKYSLGLSTDLTNKKIASREIESFLKNINKFQYNTNNRDVAVNSLNWKTIVNRWIKFTEKK
jgi:glycosyltransferase involved in cell wall biosynthesis